MPDDAIKEALGKSDVAQARRIRDARIEPGRDRRPSLYAEIQRDAVLGWSGVLPRDKCHPDSDLGREPVLSEIAADFLRMAGMNVPPTVAGRIDAGIKMRNGVQRAAYGVDDFSSWLGSTAQKSVTLGYDAAIETWKFLTQQKSVTDFRQFDVVSLPEFPSPAETPENGEVPRLQLGSDSKESSALVSSYELFGLSRQMLTNNDLTGLTTIPEALGRAASRAVGDKLFSVLAANPLMSDGEALFSAAHGNLITSGAAPSVAIAGCNANANDRAAGTEQCHSESEACDCARADRVRKHLTVLRAAMSDNVDDAMTPGLLLAGLDCNGCETR